MSQKRKHSAATGPPGGEPRKRQRNDDRGDEQQVQRFKRKPHRSQAKDADANATPKPNSINALKSRIRTLRRLLDHVESHPKNRMPAGMRIERERELETCRHELEERREADRHAEFRNKIIKKYHHIRFFERQKATRNLKKLEKQATDTDNKGKTRLLSNIHAAKIDLNYTMYYPLLRPYVSLFPKNKPETDPVPEEKKASESEHGPKGNTEMWLAVETATEKGTLDALRESTDEAIIGVQIRSISKGQVKQEPRHKKAQTQKDADAGGMHGEKEESDGGFFE